MLGKRKTQYKKKTTIQLKEIHQKIQAKKGRLKRYRCRQNTKFQNNNKIFNQQVEGDGTRICQQPVAREVE